MSNAKSSRKPELYFHQPTGNLRYATRTQAKELDSDWHKIQFVKNEQGERVMRFTFVDAQGNRATVDVQQGEDKQVDVNAKPE